MIRPQALVAGTLVAILVSGCGAWRAFFPKVEYETEPPALPADLGSPAILVFTKTNGFRHDEAIPPGVALIEEIASRRGCLEPRERALLDMRMDGELSWREIGEKLGFKSAEAARFAFRRLQAQLLAALTQLGLTNPDDAGEVEA